MTHICISKLTTISSNNGLLPGRHQAIIWTNVGILLMGTNFSEILMEIYTFSFKKMHLKMSSGKCRPFCLGLNVLTHWGLVFHQNAAKAAPWQHFAWINLKFPPWKLLGDYGPTKLTKQTETLIWCPPWNWQSAHIRSCKRVIDPRVLKESQSTALYMHQWTGRVIIFF